MIPSNWSMVPVHGRYLGSDGRAIQGTVSFTPMPDRVIDGRALTTVIRRKYTATLDYNGEYRLKLPATDDNDISPVGFTYLYEENFEGGTDYQISLPAVYAGTSVDVPSLIPQLVNRGVPASISTQEFDALVIRVDALLNGINGGNAYSVFAPGTGLGGGDVVNA